MRMRRLHFAIVLAAIVVQVHGQAAQSIGPAPPAGMLPATQPTASVSDLPSAHPAVTAAGEASVSWSGTELTIRANGDSLRNILRSISQETGMKITGGVPEETVFGSYGPGSAQTVLPQLFDGISVNVMIVNDGDTRPGELSLTQRTGTATPPQTRPISDEDQGFRRGGNMPPQRGDASMPQGRQQQGRPLQPMKGPEPPTGLAGPPSVTAPGPVTDPSAANSATPATETTAQPASPNGVRTPEQIFEELRKRQQR